MGASRQPSGSAAGTVDTALSEARTEPWELKSEDEEGSGDSGAPSHSYGTRTPHAARSQISTAAVSSPEEARPASSAAQSSASGGGESALSAAEHDADASFDEEHSSQAAQVPTAEPIVQEETTPTIPCTSGTSAAADDQAVPEHPAATLVARANSVVSHTAGATFSFPAQAQAQASSPASNPVSAPVSMEIDDPPVSGTERINPRVEEQASVRVPNTEANQAMVPHAEIPTPAASGNNSGPLASPAGAAVSVLHGDIQMSNAQGQVRHIRPARAIAAGLSEVGGSPTLSQVVPRPEIHRQAADSWKSKQYQSASNPLIYNGSSRGLPKPAPARLSPGLGFSRPPNGLQSLAGVELGPAVSEMSHPVFPTLSSPNSAPVGALFTQQLARYVFINPRPNSEVLSASRAPVAQTEHKRHAEGDSRGMRAAQVKQAGSGVSGRGPSHYPQPGISGHGHHRPYLAAGGRHSGGVVAVAPARQRAYSSSADPGAQPQMARIEGFHDRTPRPQVASIVAPVPELGTPEVVQVVHSTPQQSVPDPIAQPQMASIEGWPGPVNPQEQQGSQGDVALSCRKEDEPANPATSVHATVMMDGMSEGDDTDLSSRRHRQEDAGALMSQQGSGMNSVPAEAPMSARPAMSEMGEVMATGAQEPTAQLKVSKSASWVKPAESQDVPMDPQVQAEAQASHGDPPGQHPAAGSFHNGAPVVHPATSVHATVKAEGTLSEGDDDMTSQQGNERRNEASMEIVSGVQQFNSNGDKDSLGDKGSFKVNSEPGEGSGAGGAHPLPSTSRASNGQLPANDAAGFKQLEGIASVVSKIVPMERCGAGSTFSGPRSPPRVHSANDANHSEALASGENHHNETPAMSARVVPEPVHPATSVHATVMMDGTQSEGDTDLSSMRHDVDEARMTNILEGVEQHGQSSHKETDSQNPSVAAPALATYTGDAEMQPSSRTNSISSGLQGVAARNASRGQEARSPPAVADPGPRDAEIRDVPQPQATRSTAHGRAVTGDVAVQSEQKEIQSLMASPLSSAIIQPTVMQAAVSGTAASPTQPEGAAGGQSCAAAATLAGSPQLPKPRTRNGNGNGHRYDDASSEDDEPPRMEGAVANPAEGEGGSGTWRTKANTVQRGQGALMEGDTDHSSPLAISEARADSVGSRGSGGAPEAWENGSVGGAMSRPNSGTWAPRPAQPAVTVVYQGDASRASPSQENEQPENPGGALSATKHGGNEAEEHAGEMDAVVDCASGSISRAGSEDQAVAMASGDNEEGSLGGAQHPVEDFPQEASHKPRGNSSEAEHAGGSPTIPQTEATSPRPAHSQTEPSHAAGNESTIGSLGSNADASPGAGNGAEEPECLGPSAAQMAAAATAAAAAMSATAGTLLADGLPPLPRHRAPTTSNHFPLGSPLAGPALTPQPPPSSIKRYGGGASSSYNWRNGGSDIHVPNHGVIEEGIHLNGYYYTSNTGNEQKRHSNSNHHHANHFSATSQLPLHQPALTVMAPIGAVAGFDSPRAYSNTARGRSSYNNHYATTSHGENAFTATGVKATSRRDDGVAGENGSGPPQNYSRNSSYKIPSGGESNADMRRREGKRKRCSSGDGLEKPTESSITSSGS